MTVGSREGQLNYGKTEESHSEINAGVRHDSNRILGVNMAAAVENVENNALGVSSKKRAGGEMLENLKKRANKETNQNLRNRQIINDLVTIAR